MQTQIFVPPTSAKGVSIKRIDPSVWGQNGPTRPFETNSRHRRVIGSVALAAQDSRALNQELILLLYNIIRQRFASEH